MQGWIRIVPISGFPVTAMSLGERAAASTSRSPSEREMMAIPRATACESDNVLHAMAARASMGYQ